MKFYTREGFNSDMIDYFLAGICLKDAVVAHSNSSIAYAKDAKQQYKTALKSLTDDEHAFIVNDCRNNKLPVLSNLMHAAVHLIGKCPLAQQMNELRHIPRKYSIVIFTTFYNFIISFTLMITFFFKDDNGRRTQTYECNIPCYYTDDYATSYEDNTCGTCINDCTYTVGIECGVDCSEALGYCADPVTALECYDKVFACLDDAQGCCTCGSWWEFYSCGCCGYQN